MSFESNEQEPRDIAKICRELHSWVCSIRSASNEVGVEREVVKNLQRLDSSRTLEDIRTSILVVATKRTTTNKVSAIQNSRNAMKYHVTKILDILMQVQERVTETTKKERVNIGRRIIRK